MLPAKGAATAFAALRFGLGGYSQAWPEDCRNRGFNENGERLGVALAAAAALGGDEVVCAGRMAGPRMSQKAIANVAR